MKKKKNAGFSLIELMVVVGIIGVLASMAIPRFQEFQAKARQSEAKTNLNYIATLQEAYYDDPISNNNYYPMAAGMITVSITACDAAQTLGFRPSPCNKLAYMYVITGNGNVHLTTATEDGGRVFMCSTSPNSDIWSINQSRNLLHSRLGMSC